MVAHSITPLFPKRLNVEHRTSNVEHRIMMSLCSSNYFNRIPALVFVFHSTFDVGRSMFDVHFLICSMFVFLSKPYKALPAQKITCCSWRQAPNFGTKDSLNGNHLDLGSLVQPFGVYSNFDQAVGFYHCVYKS